MKSTKLYIFFSSFKAHDFFFLSKNGESDKNTTIWDSRNSIFRSRSHRFRCLVLFYAKAIRFKRSKVFCVCFKQNEKKSVSIFIPAYEAKREYVSLTSEQGYKVQTCSCTVNTKYPTRNTQVTTTLRRIFGFIQISSVYTSTSNTPIYIEIKWHGFCIWVVINFRHFGNGILLSSGSNA